LGLIVRAGFVQNRAEKTAEVADGQGNPPEVTTGTGWLANAADDVALLHVPAMVVAPVVVELARQVWPRTLAVHETAFCGMVKLAGPAEDAHRFQVLLVVQVAGKLKNPALTVHPLSVGGVMLPQIGCPEAEVTALPLVDETVQVTVAVPSLKVALVPEHSEALKAPVGETLSANALWSPTSRRPSPNTAARPRVMRICVAFMVVTPVEVDCHRHGCIGIQKIGVVWVPHSISHFESYCKTAVDKIKASRSSRAWMHYLCIFSSWHRRRIERTQRLIFVDIVIAGVTSVSIVRSVHMGSVAKM
jgi:hypothetical protein